MDCGVKLSIPGMILVAKKDFRVIRGVESEGFGWSLAAFRENRVEGVFLDLGIESFLKHFKYFHVGIVVLAGGMEFVNYSVASSAEGGGEERSGLIKVQYPAVECHLWALEVIVDKGLTEEQIITLLDNVWRERATGELIDDRLGDGLEVRVFRLR